MNNHIYIDVTDAKECAVAEDKFRIIRFNIGNVKMKDLIYQGPPFLPFSGSATRKWGAKGESPCVFRGTPEIQLFIGCTENIYIKSLSVESKPDELMNILPQAAHWFRFHKDSSDKEQ